jgi:hypothetical protein
MKNLLAVLALAGAVPASAACIGNDPVKWCTDANGNRYTMSTIGNSTFINGTTADGHKYSKETHRIGDTVQTSGTAPSGRKWGTTTTAVATYGTDEQGNPVYQRH